MAKEAKEAASFKVSGSWGVRGRQGEGGGTHNVLLPFLELQVSRVAGAPAVKAL